jgi:hypothetical protein
MDRPSWNLKELRDHVRTLPGDRKFMLDVIASLDWSNQIFQYHFQTARDALREIPVDDEPNMRSNLELLFSSSEEHDYRMLVIRANVLSCVHTTRNAYDHLAQIINALMLSSSIPIKDCDIKKVHRRLPSSKLHQEINNLLESHWFQYVAAYSNASKHRALVQQALYLSFSDGKAGIRAESFTHDKVYPAYMVGDLLDGILEVKNHIVACGSALNSELLRANA